MSLIINGNCTSFSDQRNGEKGESIVCFKEGQRPRLYQGCFIFYFALSLSYSFTLCCVSYLRIIYIA